MTGADWDGYVEAVRGLGLLEQAKGKHEAGARLELSRRQERIGAEERAARERSVGWAKLADEAAAHLQRACEQGQIAVPDSAAVESGDLEAVEITRQLSIARSALDAALVDLASQRRVERRRREQEEQARAKRELQEQQRREAAARRNRILAIASAVVALLAVLAALLLL